jgi:drug/metabolite transporter (DMT)-like permease
MSLQIVLLVAVLVLANATGEVLIAKSMRELGEISTLRLPALLKLGWRLLGNKFFVTGFVLMTLNFLVFLVLLSIADLSLVMPLTALGFVIKTVGAKIFLHESISRERLIGTLLVCAGVALISLPT